MDRDFSSAGTGGTLTRFASISSLGELEFEGIAATNKLCDDGYALDIAGGNISRFRDGGGALLLQHDVSKVIGTASLRKTSNSVMLRGRFASPGISTVADDTRRLLKDGVLRGLSMTFSIQDSERIGNSPKGGRRATKWTALEVSVVAVGMDPDAVVTQRALSQLLARSGRRLSAETERCLRAALESHSAGMKSHREAIGSQRQTRDMLKELLDRDDSGMDETERARRKFELELLKRRWAPGELAAAADFERRQRELALLKRRWPPGTLDISAVRAERQRQLQQRELVIRRIP
jgi:HK97 family phage prohead protease